jgi:hypothetical protein
VLLHDYVERQRSQILDYLFAPPRDPAPPRAPLAPEESPRPIFGTARLFFAPRSFLGKFSTREAL